MQTRHTARLFIIILALYLLSQEEVYSQNIPVVNISSQQQIITSFPVGLIIDYKKDNSITQIAKIPTPQKIVLSRYNLPSIDPNYWFMFQIKNQMDEKIYRIIRFDEVYMENADIYYQNKNDWYHESNGLSKPLHLRTIPNRAPVFLVSLKPGETKTIYLKLHSKFVLVVGIHVESISQFALTEQWQTIGYWAYFGAALAILLYNMFLLITLRDRAYLYYVIYVANFILFVFLYSGYFLYINSNVQLHYILHGSIALTGAFLSLFTRELLNTKKNLPYIDKFLLGGFGCFILIALLIMLDIRFYLWLEIFGMISMLSMFFLGFYYLAKKIPLAKFYTLAISFYLLGLSLIAAVNLGFVAYNFFTRYSFLMGSLVELSLFSLALGYRIKLLQEEKLVIQNKLLTTEQSMKKHLEQEVIKRTAALKEAVKAKNKFFSIIAHDLRSPIGSISVILDSINNGEMNLSQKFLSLMTNSVSRISSLLEDLLLWSRNQKGQIQLHPMRLNLMDLIADTIQVHILPAEQKNIPIRIQCESPDLSIYADRTTIMTVIRNLVGNAIKFTPNGGKISVISEKSNGKIKITIKDTGIGLGEEAAYSLFSTNAVIISSPGTNNESGTGLGLTLCQEFVQANNGEIGVISHPGKGCEFWFTLPDGAKIPFNQKDFSEIKNRIRGFKALVCEDNPLHLQTTNMVLIQMGIESKSCANGTEGLSSFQKEKYDLIFLDIDMPGINGVDLARQIHEQKKEQLIFALTSYDEEEIISRYGKAPFNGYINKPLDKETLLRVIDKTLQQTAASKSQNPPDLLPSAKILLVDDNIDNQVLYGHFLAKMGFDVEMASSGIDALAKIHENDYTCILLDIHLPDIDGFEIMARIRPDKPGGGSISIPPIFAFTANDSQELLKQIDKDSFFSTIKKPINYSELRSVLIEFLPKMQK